MTRSFLLNSYFRLLEQYGKQGWWPVNYQFLPRKWEVCIGAVLTQHTSWTNVERVLLKIFQSGCISVYDMTLLSEKKLQKLILGSGFFKQKALCLHSLSNLILSFGSFSRFRKKITREELLRVKGIGYETADCILLYACDKPYFVIDQYTKRLCRKLGVVKKDYEDYRLFFEKQLPRDIALYKEFHALIVRAGKEQFKELFDQKL